MSHDYILISPIKNEGEHLPQVINSMLNQSKLPTLWIIIDDGSTDKTPEILHNLEKKCNWVKIIRLPEHPYDKHIHYAYVCRVGFDFAIKYCEKNNISYDFIGLLDGDTILEPLYFDKLLNEFQKNIQLGIASGGIYYKNEKGLSYEKTFDDFPRGTGRLWTKKCFFDTGGYALDPAMHTISNIKAELRGYQHRQFKNIQAIQTRKTSSIGGLWNNKISAGKVAYYLYRRPIIVLMNAFIFTLHPPFYGGIAYMIGYFSAIKQRKPRITDEEIIFYFKKQKLTQLIKLFIKS